MVRKDGGLSGGADGPPVTRWPWTTRTNKEYTMGRAGHRPGRLSYTTAASWWAGKENNLDNGEKQLWFCARQPPRAIGMADTKKRVLKTLFYKLLMLFPISSSCLTPWPGVTALVSDTLRCDGALAVGHGVRHPSEFATTVRTGYQLQCRILAASQSRSNCLLPEYGATMYLRQGKK